MDSSYAELIFTRQLYPITVVAPAPDFHSHGAGFAFTQPRNKFGEGDKCLISADVLTLDAVGNNDNDESIFSISSFFLIWRRWHE
ncbi:MAG: hypothetical protein OEL52_01025 [Nitrosopumilus sp.]|nr:hypothetical protein [Nitrosopumilus sp.]